jgi:hypothetical protein
MPTHEERALRKMDEAADETGRLMTDEGLANLLEKLLRRTARPWIRRRGRPSEMLRVASASCGDSRQAQRGSRNPVRVPGLRLFHQPMKCGLQIRLGRA